jgi:hypothetical protein
MVKDASHILFDDVEIKAGQLAEGSESIFAIDTLTDKATFIQATAGEDAAECCAEYHLHEPVSEEIQVLEVAFHKGKTRKTTFSVDYIDDSDKKHHIGTFTSPGDTNNYTKYLFPDKVKNLKTLVITFKHNSDRSPWFGVKGIRLAKFIEKPL